MDGYFFAAKFSSCSCRLLIGLMGSWLMATYLLLFMTWCQKEAFVLVLFPRSYDMRMMRWFGVVGSDQLIRLVMIDLRMLLDLVGVGLMLLSLTAGGLLASLVGTNTPLPLTCIGFSLP